MSYGGRGGDHRQLKCFEERGNWRVPRTGRYGTAVGRTATRNPLASSRGASWGPKSVVTRCGEGSMRGEGKEGRKLGRTPGGSLTPSPWQGTTRRQPPEQVLISVRRPPMAGKVDDDCSSLSFFFVSFRGCSCFPIFDFLLSGDANGGADIVDGTSAMSHRRPLSLKRFVRVDKSS